MRGGAGAMPELVPPMQVSAGTGQPPTGPDWVVELAWTGHRCIAYVEPGRRTRLLSSGAVSMTAAYPELVAALERRSHPGGMVLDGTLVARGEEHAPRAARLQRRSARHRPSEGHIARVPVDFQVADLLWLDGHATVELAYRDRRALLEGLGFDAPPIWATSPMPVTELSALLRVAEAKGVDALHARHLGSRYKPGQRSPLWVRVPVPRLGQVVVGGWTPVDAARPDRIASLLVGVPGPGDGLLYVGRVGVAGEERRHVTGLLELRRDSPPFTGDLPRDAARYAIWVEPRVRGLVEFVGFTADGRLRLPRWHGLAGPDAVRWARREAGEDGAAPPPAAEATPAVPEDSPAAAETEPEVPPAAAEKEPEVPPAAAEKEPGTDELPPAAPDAVEQHRLEQHRLEQHFVYNSLNTIASLIRTDPARARELLMGFSDLTRAADRAGTTTSLGRELETVGRYLSLEQARFGRRLRVEIDVDAALHDVPVEPLTLLAAVRDAVQRDIEPRTQGGVLSVRAAGDATGCMVTVVGGSGDPRTIPLTI